MHTHLMVQYLQLAHEILRNGQVSSAQEERTGTGTKSLFGQCIKFNLSEQFPLLTNRLIRFKNVVHEIIWYLSGSTNTEYLTKNGVNIWNRWADANGELGPVYGAQWRGWGEASQFRSIDQIKNLERTIQQTPHSRRMIVSAWNVSELRMMALPPCPLMFQIYCRGERMSMTVYQRSADVFIGLPHDIAGHALILSLLCKVHGYTPDELIFMIGDAHIYDNHTQQVEEMLEHGPRQGSVGGPFIKIDDRLAGKSILSATVEDIELIDYHPGPDIKASVAI